MTERSMSVDDLYQGRYLCLTTDGMMHESKRSFDVFNSPLQLTLRH